MHVKNLNLCVQLRVAYQSFVEIVAREIYSVSLQAHGFI